MALGFGFGRMGGTFPQAPQKVAKEWTIPWWSSGELGEENVVNWRKDLEIIHKESVDDFAGASGQKRSSAAARKEKTWEVKSLDLVGLVKHDEPVAYVGEKLDMGKLKDLPTRALDGFEMGSNIGVAASQRLDFANRADDRRVISVAEGPSQVG